MADNILAGILCTIVSHPADVMVSKLNASRQPGEAFGSAMGRIYKDIGFGGLWNGLVIRIFMIGTLTSLRKSVLTRLVHGNANKGDQNGVSTTASKSSWASRRQEVPLQRPSKWQVYRYRVGRKVLTRT